MSVLVVCVTVLVLWWRAEPFMDRAMKLAERPKIHPQTNIPWNHLMIVADRLCDQAEERTRNRVLAPGPILLIKAIAQELTPFLDRYFDQKKPPEAKFGDPPAELMAMALNESEDWAKASAQARMWELAQLYGGDWGRVQTTMMSEQMNGVSR